MITRILKTITSYITKLKVRRASKVIDAFADLTSAQVAMLVPVALEFYRRGAHIIVAKTAENPQPLLALMDALRQTVEHYGPALAAEFAVAKQEHDARANAPGLASRADALSAALEEFVRGQPDEEKTHG